MYTVVEEELRPKSKTNLFSSWAQFFCYHHRLAGFSSAGRNHNDRRSRCVHYLLFILGEYNIYLFIHCRWEWIQTLLKKKAKSDQKWRLLNFISISFLSFSLPLIEILKIFHVFWLFRSDLWMSGILQWKHLKGSFWLHALGIKAMESWLRSCDMIVLIWFIVMLWEGSSSP